MHKKACHLLIAITLLVSFGSPSVILAQDNTKQKVESKKEATTTEQKNGATVTTKRETKTVVKTASIKKRVAKRYGKRFQSKFARTIAAQQRRIAALRRQNARLRKSKTRTIYRDRTTTARIVPTLTNDQLETIAASVAKKLGVVKLSTEDKAELKKMVKDELTAQFTSLGGIGYTETQWLYIAGLVLLLMVILSLVYFRKKVGSWFLEPYDPTNKRSVWQRRTMFRRTEVPNIAGKTDTEIVEEKVIDETKKASIISPTPAAS